MKIAILGRTELLYDTLLLLKETGYQISCIVTSKAAPEYKKKSRDFEIFAAKWKIPYMESAETKTDVYNFLLNYESDIAISVNFPKILPAKIINLYKLGILNSHGGDLPKYRGNACQAWAILNGEQKIGLCIHKMIGDELDAGDIIARDYLPIDLTTKVGFVWEWMTSRTPQLFIEALERLDSNPNYILERQSKQERDALRCYPLIPEDGAINWSNTAQEILRVINAFNKPYDGAFFFYNRKKIIIWDAELVNDEEVFCAKSGQVTKISSEFIEVACGKDKLRILEIEKNGEIAKPSELFKSIRVRLT
jgi:methionyl-tRNA formyltransferase